MACKCHRNCSKRANFHVMNVFHNFVWNFTSLERQKRLLWALQSTRKIVGYYIYKKWRSAFLMELIFYLQMTKFPNEWYVIPIDYEIIPWKISCEKLISHKYGFFCVKFTMEFTGQQINFSVELVNSFSKGTCFNFAARIVEFFAKPNRAVTCLCDYSIYCLSFRALKLYPGENLAKIFEDLQRSS